MGKLNINRTRLDKVNKTQQPIVREIPKLQQRPVNQIDDRKSIFEQNKLEKNLPGLVPIPPEVVKADRTPITASTPVTPTPTPSITPTITPTSTITPTPSITPTITPTSTITPTPSVTPEATPSPTPSITPSITPTQTITPTPSVTPEATPSPTPSITPSITPTQTITPTPTPTPSQQAEVFIPISLQVLGTNGETWIVRYNTVQQTLPGGVGDVSTTPSGGEVSGTIQMYTGLDVDLNIYRNGDDDFGGDSTPDAPGTTSIIINGTYTDLQNTTGHSNPYSFTSGEDFSQGTHSWRLTGVGADVSISVVVNEGNV